MFWGFSTIIQLYHTSKNISIETPKKFWYCKFFLRLQKYLCRKGLSKEKKTGSFGFPKAARILNGLSLFINYKDSLMTVPPERHKALPALHPYTVEDIKYQEY